MKVLYFDCFSGISGDMTVGALIDLGVKPSTLEWELSKLDIGDFHMHFDRKKRGEVEGVHFSIHEGATHRHDQDEDGHDHDHGHEEHAHAHHHHHHDDEEEDGHHHHHGHGHEQSHEHEHKHEEHHHCGGCEDHDHGHETEHSHVHTHHHEHHHVHGRSHWDIRALIENSELSHFVKKHALGIFERIAKAEGKIHGMPPEEVTFHEVGALDSIADIICSCVGIESLGIKKVFVSALHDGHGWIDCAHGRFPVPAPATAEILSGIPLGQIDEPHELITPTGAAIVAEFAESFGLMPRLKSERIGYGVGSRELDSRPNVLRAVLGELVPE